MQGALQTDCTLCRISISVSSSILSFINKIETFPFLGYYETKKTDFATIISLMQSFFYYLLFSWLLFSSVIEN